MEIASPKVIACDDVPIVDSSALDALEFSKVRRTVLVDHGEDTDELNAAGEVERREARSQRRVGSDLLEVDAGEGRGRKGKELKAEGARVGR